MYQLTEYDARILTFISGAGSATIDDVQRRFPSIDSAQHRVRLLSSADCAMLSQDCVYRKSDFGSLCREDLGIYRLTPSGKKALEDFRTERKTHKRELWLKSVWLPMLVAFGTTILTLALKEWLWPLIQRLG